MYPLSGFVTTRTPFPGFRFNTRPARPGLGRYLDSAAGSVAASLRGSSKNGLTTRSRPNFWPCYR